MKFIIKKSKKSGKFFFHLESGNHKIVAPSQQYKRKAYALRTVRSIKMKVYYAQVVDETKAAK